MVVIIVTVLVTGAFFILEKIKNHYLVGNLSEDPINSICQKISLKSLKNYCFALVNAACEASAEERGGV